MNDEQACCTPSSPSAQAATNTQVPHTVEGHKNPDWVPAGGMVYGKGRTDGG